MVVNGTRIERPTRLGPGDRIAVGSSEIVVIAEERAAGERRRAMIVQLTSDSVARPAVASEPEEPEDEPPPPSSSTTRTDGLALVAAVADRALAAGDVARAEEMLMMHLRELLSQTRSGRRTTPEQIERAVGYALELARATGKGAWIDYALQLATLGVHVLGSQQVQLVDGLVTTGATLRADVLRNYVEALRKRESAMSLDERFTLRKLEALSSRLASR